MSGAGGGGRDKTASVNCGSCTACCRRELVALVESDQIADYPAAVEFNAEGKAHLRALIPDATGWVIPHQPGTGACVYLGETGCTIYDKRPAMCRVFSCVGWVESILACTTRAERRRDARTGLIDKEIWAAGVARSSRRVAAPPHPACGER